MRDAVYKSSIADEPNIVQGDDMISHSIPLDEVRRNIILWAKSQKLGPVWQYVWSEVLVLSQYSVCS